VTFHRAGIPGDDGQCDGRGMTDDRRPGTPWFAWLLVGAAALFAARFAAQFALHAVAHVADLVSGLVLLGVLGLVGWKLAVGSRRSRHRD
jgi:hypothetical protein